MAWAVSSFAAAMLSAQSVVENFESYPVGSNAAYLRSNNARWVMPSTAYNGLSTKATVARVNLGSAGANGLSIPQGGSGAMAYYVRNTSDTLTISTLVRPSNATGYVSHGTVTFGVTTDGGTTPQHYASITFDSRTDRYWRQIAWSINNGSTSGYISSPLATYSSASTYHVSYTVNFTTRTGYLAVYDVSRPGAANTWTSPQSSLGGGSTDRDFAVIFHSGSGTDETQPVVFDDVTYTASGSSGDGAPVITTPPASQTVTAGQSATMSVVATGSPTPTYQWRRDGAAITGATNATFTLASVQPADAGSYTVVVTNTGGSVTSSAGTLTVLPSQSVIENFESYPVGSNAAYLRSNNARWVMPSTAYNGLSTTATVARVNLGSAGSNGLSIPRGGSGVMAYYVRNTSDSLTISTLVRPSNATGYVSHGTVTFGVTTDGGTTPQHYASITFDSRTDRYWRQIAWSINNGSTSGYISSPLATYSSSSTYHVSYTVNFTTRAGYLSVYDVSRPGAANTWTSPQSSLGGGSTDRDFAVIFHPGSGSDETQPVVFDDVTYTASGSSSGGAPVITTAPASQTVTAGQSATMSVVATGSPAPTYQWHRDGVAIAGATSAFFTLSSAQPANAGSYTVVVTNSAGSVTSAAGTLTVAFSRLINLSILTSIDTPGDAFTLGYVVGGGGTTGEKALVIRAAGPSLAALGASGTLDDPKIEFFAGATKTGENDNWGGSSAVASAMAAVGAFAYSGPTSRDAAGVFSVATRDNSVKVSAAGAGTGTVIAEIYDATPSSSFTHTTPRLVNVSVLKPLGSGFTVGFVVGGSGGKTVLIRAIGPTLGTVFGVSGAVPDPQIKLFSGSTQVGANDDWGGTTALSNAFRSVGAFALPSGSYDAALVTTLQPGSYTAQVSAVGSTSGIVIVEVYEVP